MRTVSRKTTGLLATLLLAGILGVMVLLHVTSRQEQRCGTVTTDNISMIKLIYS